MKSQPEESTSTRSQNTPAAVGGDRIGSDVAGVNVFHAVDDTAALAEDINDTEDVVAGGKSFRASSVNLRFRR